jgi:hypothetical protein
MELTSRVLSTVVGGVFGAAFALLKYRELVTHPLVGPLVEPVPEQWLLSLGVALFAVAGFRLGRLGLGFVVVAFVGFFVVEFFAPPMFEELVRWMYVVYVVVPFVLVVTGGLRVLPSVPLVPSGFLR